MTDNRERESETESERERGRASERMRGSRMDRGNGGEWLYECGGVDDAARLHLLLSLPSSSHTI